MAIAESIAAVPNPRRWFHLTPGKLLVALLAVEGVLLLSERWFPKGWAVLIAVAAVGVFLLVMLLWFAIALLLRRRFQFSIRSLMLLTIAVAVPCSWLAVKMKAANEQRETIQPLFKWGGIVYDYEMDSSGRAVKGMLSPPPAWMLKVFGDDFFGNVICIDLSNSNITDDDLKYLEKVKQLPLLFLQETQITDAGLEHLEGLQIEWLVLYKNQITDAGLKHLKGVKQLKNLSLSGTTFTDAGLEHLKKLKPLKILSLCETQITDTGLGHLKEMKQLESLTLDGTPITDNALAQLAELKQLKWLSLDKTQITDDHLEYLEGLKQLKLLFLCETQVTAAGVAKLQKALPDCKIYH